MNNIYAGIGKRTTPDYILRKMSTIGKYLEEQGYTLRSGGAVGPDRAFALHSVSKEIYLPGNKYLNDRKAEVLAKYYHPDWSNLDQYARECMTRNMYIILGASLDVPVDFVVCWTPTGYSRGGTNHAIRAAKHNNIPVCNLVDEDFITFLKHIKVQ